MKKILKSLSATAVLLFFVIVMTQQFIAAEPEVLSVGKSKYAYSISGYGTRYFKIHNAGGTNNVQIATYGEGELELRWFGNNAITSDAEFSSAYSSNASFKALVDNAKSKTTKTHDSNVCLSGQQILSGDNYFMIKNNSKSGCAVVVYIKIGSNGEVPWFDTKIAEDYSNPIPAKEADCVHNATYEGYKCAHNEDLYILIDEDNLYFDDLSLEIPGTALGHIWDAGTITTASTCVKNGVRTYVCTRTGCNEKKTEPVALDLKNHANLTETVTKQATCKEAGEKLITCADCKAEIKKESIPKTEGHVWNEGVVTKTATCKAEGEKTITCTVCGGTKKESIPKTEGHVWNEGVVTKKATCKAEGEKTITCTVCGGTKKESIPKTEGHVWNEGVVTKKATCKAEGEKTITCTVCSGTKKEIINRTDAHIWESYVSKEPTTSAKGERTYTCTVCGLTKMKAIDCLPSGSKDPGMSEGGSSPSQPVDHLYTRISDDAVSYEGTMTEVVDVVIPSTVKMSGKVYKVTTISDKAFAGNKKLVKVTIPDTVTEIGYKAFCGCTSLKTVVMGSKVTTIGTQAFSKCTSLKSIVIPKSVKKIGSYAFYKCKKLKTITIKTTKLTGSKVGKGAFYKMYSKVKITVPTKKYSKYKKLLKSRGVTGSKQKIVKK